MGMENLRREELELSTTMSTFPTNFPEGASGIGGADCVDESTGSARFNCSQIVLRSQQVLRHLIGPH
ncbi:hypothetical protein F2Q69_00008597 [Brassica cretica]|uniref:Uncharacterized protein n=1 Tax=Brassica cretica TaxID=69181 RepID=A0A8S9PIT9_BRACR|nr:hypothetical protein F2Q69_00008597 [Brassica cretica]